ncbi:MAG: tyrosine-type recombinase/integrase [Myxococcaceae bacterium]
MPERYFLLPTTIDRIRGCWLAKPIEQYIGWLTERRFTASSIARRVPLIMRFGEFARRRGAVRVDDLPEHLDAFVRRELRRRLLPCRSPRARHVFGSDLRRPIEQMLRVGFPRPPVPASQPFVNWAPDFFTSLRQERGLQDATIRLYRHNLARFEEYLARRGIRRPSALAPVILDGFIVESRRRNSPQSLRGVCSALRAFLRYLFREEFIRSDLSCAVQGPRTYRLAEIPRSIAWDEVMRTLKSVDRRSALGKRDYAILLLLSVYGLRAREVAALTLDDLEWRAGTLHVRGRKAGHATSYPLAPQVGDALLDYLKHGRPTTSHHHRRVFLVARAPREPITGCIVARQARRYLLAAGAEAPRLGSHTLRHSVAQRLVEADFSLKVIGDYLGHRSPASTQVYTKVSVEPLRELALSGEEIL